MKYAAAMKYGGELVDAAECNYDSFKQLVPLCPECKEPVHLRAACDRVSIKGKPFKIGQHWAHFAGKSAEQIAACESRVNGYTEKDRQRIAAQARGQRLKLLQRWFWDVWLRRCQEAASIEGRPLLSSPAWKIQDAPEKVLRNLPDAWGYFCKEINYYKSKPVEIAFSVIDQTATFYVEEKPGYLDMKIAFEVFDYLSSKKSQALSLAALLLVAEGIYQVQIEKSRLGHPDIKANDRLAGSVDAAIKYMESVGPLGFASSSTVIAKRAEAYLFTIPWVSEFQRLEAEATQQKKSA